MDNQTITLILIFSIAMIVASFVIGIVASKKSE